MALDVLATALDEVLGIDPSALADTESIEVLYRQHARLEAVLSAATAAFDAAGNWVPDGAKSAPAWLASRCRVPKQEARGMLRRGRGLRHLPATEEALAAGDITSAQVDVMVGLRRPATEEALARDEELLVTQGSELPFQGFLRAAAYWNQLADPNRVEDDEEKRRGRRDVFLDRSFGDMWLGKITLDPISGAIVGGELRRLEQELFEADWAEATTRLGRSPTGADLNRTPGQRRADALVEMATRSLMAPADGRRPAPLFSVLVGWETLRGRVCELADGPVIAPGALLPWLTEAYLERVVFTPGRRTEVSVTARLFTGATRRAIELRDRECAHPFCDVPSSQCQADHILPVAVGGPTVEENGRMLCGFHNRLRNQRPPPDD